MSRSARVYRMVTDEHVCPFGIKAKDLLERRGYVVDDRRLTTRAEADAFQAEHEVDTTPQVFIEGERIGGYEALRARFFGSTDAEDGKTYQPILAVFGVTFLMATAATWAAPGPQPLARAFEWFVAFSMGVLAVLKLRDLESFSNQFITYDLLARRVVRYAYVYPFAEALAAIGMIGRIALPLAQALALFIGSIGAVSVIKAVYVEHRDLKCACVGGDSNVPLGFISLTENLMMVFMAFWMGLA